jgi:caa(3)-type oxidase subunit IV
MTDTTATTPAADAAHGGGHGHTNYVKIWAILLGLLVVSVVGPMAGIKWLTLITAFGIAFVKAGLVVKYFMHIGVERKFVPQLLITMLAIMGIMFAGFAPDVLNHKGTRWVNTAAEKPEPTHAHHGEHAEHGAAPASAGEHHE